MAKFDCSRIGSTALHWYPSHMARAVERIKKRLEGLDLIVEVRDARAPFSSANPMLEELCQRKDRIVLFNKLDLADPAANSRLSSYCRSSETIDGPYKTEYLMMTTKQDPKLKLLLRRIKDRIREARQGAEESAKDPKMMVVGMPNVGKSTILNRLRALGTDRGGYAVGTGAIPGITRALSGRVLISEDPRIFMVDTPGILVPRVADIESSLKVALCGGMLDRLVGEYLLCEYLLWALNSNGLEKEYSTYYGVQPTSSLDDLIPAIAKHAKTVESDGRINMTNTLCTFLKAFRVGALGRITLDTL